MRPAAAQNLPQEAPAEAGPLGWFLDLPVWLQFVLAYAAVYLLLGTIDRSAFRVLGRVSIVAVPLFGLVWLALHHLDLQFSENERLLPALLAGGVVALGWVVTFGLQEYRRDADYRRQQVDVMMALQAEIYDFLLQAAETDTQRTGAVQAQRIVDGEDGGAYHVFAPTGKAMVAFEALGERLDVLPDKTLRPIVAFYTQVNDVRQFSRDLQRPDYMALKADRRRAVYEDYVKMRLKSEELGLLALAALNENLGRFRRVTPPVPSREGNEDG